MPLSTLTHRDYRRPYRPFTATAPDGVRLAGAHFEGHGRDVVVIYAHGFGSGKNARAVPGFLERLAARVDVMAFDFRGHGESGGRASFGDAEIDDLAAVVRLARAAGYRHVVTLGSSMGGATAIRHAALEGGVDGVATIGAYATALPLGRPATALALRLAFGTRAGRAWTAAALGARLGPLRLDLPQPIDVVDRVAPAPLLLIHGAWDALIARGDAQALYQCAGAPKDLFVVPRRGHDHHLLRSGAVMDRLTDWIAREVVVNTALINVC